MENYCAYGTSNSHAQPLNVGASSQALSSIRMPNASKNGFHTTIPNGSRHVGKKQVQLTDDHANERESKPPGALELSTTDPKHIKRIANRLSAQRSRKRKLEYKAELEAKAKGLQENITGLSLRKEDMTHKNKLLRIEKKILEQKMYHLGWKSKIREVKIEKTKVEIMQIIELRNLGRQKNVNEPDLTLSLALPGIHAK